MREIKFRAWDKKYEDMGVSFKLEDVFGIPANLINEAIGNEELIFLQYTGLEDSNGIEIYEGDIVRYPEATGNDDHITIAFVEWEEDRARFIARFRDYPEHHLGPILHRADYLRHYEVIGNIYENPELLEANA